MRALRRITDELRALTLREAIDEVQRAVRENDLLTFASAVAFGTLFAIIPLALFGLGLLGGLGLDDQWTHVWAPTVRGSMSTPAFEVVDDTVRRVLGQQQSFWMTAGGALAIWKISSTTRTIMDAFGRIYASHRERTFAERIRDSVLLGGAVTGLLLAATACVVLGGAGLRGAGLDSGWISWLRWPLALTLLFGVVALLVAHAPADRQPARWVGFGSIVVVVAWTGTSLMLAWYVTSIADYGSIFGALSSAVIALLYLYLASAAVLIGAQLDALVRERVARDTRDEPPGVAQVTRSATTTTTPATPAAADIA
ncbi:MAG TPA: YihY/virulence factor BrkB family protein [Solirubrobacteraceae bacterium]